RDPRRGGAPQPRNRRDDARRRRPQPAEAARSLRDQRRWSHAAPLAARTAAFAATGGASTRLRRDAARRSADAAVRSAARRPARIAGPRTDRIANRVAIG